MDDFGMALQRRKSVSPARRSLANAIGALGGHKPIEDPEDDYIQKLYAQEAIKQQFQDPTERKLREAKINALNQPPPKGFVRVGTEIQPDPDYISPVEQHKMDALTPGQERQQDESVKEIYQTREMNAAKRRLTDNALQGAENIPQGIFGKMRLGVAKSLPFTKNIVGINDSQIQDAQDMKMALTMGSLAETAYTKGAISDQEMALFKEASANDDFNNPGVIPVIQKIRSFLDAEENALYGAYQRNYNEDPRKWFAEQQTQPQQASQVDPQMEARKNALRQRYGR